jgi:putative GTP pyrophosphokinase
MGGFTKMSKKLEPILRNSMDALDIFEIAKEFSLPSGLSTSLKNSTQKFKWEDIIIDLCQAREIAMEKFDSLKLPNTVLFRVKSENSCSLKFNKFVTLGTFPLSRALNDIVGFRVICDYSIKAPAEYTAVNMLSGKKNDDGYRGMHYYYQASNMHYPVEIQVNSEHDSFFNVLLHECVSKYESANEIGSKLRKLYESGNIYNRETFIKELLNVSSSKKI